MLLFPIRCCSPVFGINPIEFASIIMWAVREKDGGSNSLTMIYVYMYVYIHIHILGLHVHFFPPGVDG